MRQMQGNTPPYLTPSLVCLLTPEGPKSVKWKEVLAKPSLGPFVLHYPSQETCSTSWLECLTEGVLFSQGLWGSVPLSHAQPILHHNAMLYLLHWHHWHLETLFHGSRIDFFFFKAVCGNVFSVSNCQYGNLSPLYFFQYLGLIFWGCFVLVFLLFKVVIPLVM